MTKNTVLRNTNDEIMLIPEEAVNIIRACFDRSDESNWIMGDTVNVLRDELCKRRGDWDRLTRRAAIEGRCDESTVRDRASMASFFQPADRTEFELSYHQFRACKSSGRDLWRTYAERAVKSADDYAGRAAPVSVIRAWIAQDKNGKPKELPWLVQARRIVRACISAAENQEASDEWANACREFYRKAAEILPEELDK